MNPPDASTIRSILGAVVVTLVLLATACSSDDGAAAGSAERSSTTEVTTSTSAPDAPAGVDPTPQPSATAAVARMLELLQTGDASASYRLLDDAGRRAFASVVAWERRRAGAAPITAFEVEDADAEAGEVVALVSHDPVLDPFQGLVPARERQTWSVEQVDGGWLVGAQPVVELLLPPDAGAAREALAWVRDVQRCDEEAARARQAVEILFNAATELKSVCGATGSAAAGAVGNLEAGPVSADVVAQYSSDALTWARTVPITIGDLRLTVILAPIGDSWEVLGVSD